MPIPLSDLLKRIPQDTRERIESTRKRVNNAVREAMRRETGLLLNRQGQLHSRQENVAVPVKLCPGLPDSLRPLTFPDNFELVLCISPYRRALEQARAGLLDLEPLVVALAEVPAARAAISQSDNTNDTLQFVQALLDLLQREDPVARILEVNEDVLGVYRYPLRKTLFKSADSKGAVIELYWSVIGLVAGMLGLYTEPLAVVVLIHELAHAYTHLGADIDGDRWSNEDFSQADHPLKEGLAQYYTALVSQRIDDQVPGTYAAYKTLCKHQPPAYRTQEPWLQNHQPEEVRLSMVALRRRGEGRLTEFENGLRMAREQLRGNEDAE